MIQKPIVINDMDSPILNTRLQYIEEGTEKNGKNGICFTKYITEKERLKKLELNKNEEKQWHSQPNKIEKIIEEKILLGLVQQPQMRFKPRTDTERIIDTLNEKNLISSKERKILAKQLKNIGVGVPFKITSESLANPMLKNTILGKNLHNPNVMFKVDPENLSESERQKRLEEINKISEIRKKCIIETRNKAKINEKNTNKAARNILKSFHVKSKFKALSSVICNSNLVIPQVYISTINENIDNYRVKDEIVSNIKQKKKEKILKLAKQLEIHKRDSSSDSDVACPKSQIDFYKEEKDEVDFKLNYNPLIKFEENVVDYTKLRKAKHIFNQNTDEENKKESNFKNVIKKLITNKGKKNNNFKNENNDDKKEEEKVVIENETINKKDKYTMAKKVLIKCNYYHKKNKNNDVRHEARKGKMMCTNGMSVKDFEREYGLEFVGHKGR